MSHEFLFLTLEKFGCGPDYQQWIRLLYTAVASSVKVNGWLTTFIPLQCGLRQGCALSMPLYVLTAELLATHIRAHPNIKGLQPIIFQYASILLADDDSITYVFQIFQTYEEGCWC